jgi:hypothetical protein
MDFYPDRSSEPELRTVEVRLLGTGASAPTKVYGKGITVARTGAGVYTLTFSASPGTYAGCLPGLDATTPGDIKNHSVICTATSATVITVNFYDAAAAARDLAAAEWINLSLKFKASNA